MNKKGAIVFLLAFVMLFSFILSVSAYSNNAGVCTSNSCSDAMNAMADNFCHVTNLNTDINGGCSVGSDTSGAVFDCQGHSVGGAIRIYENSLIRNCMGITAGPFDGQPGIEIDDAHSDNITILNNVIQLNQAGGGINAAIGGVAGGDHKNINIIGNTINGNFEMILLIDSSNTNFSFNNISIYGTGVDLKGVFLSGDNMSVTNNRISGSDGAVDSSGLSGHLSVDGNKNYISDNYIQGKFGTSSAEGIKINGDYNIVKDNTIVNATGYGLKTVGNRNNVSDNIIYGTLNRSNNGPTQYFPGIGLYISGTLPSSQDHNLYTDNIICKSKVTDVYFGSDVSPGNPSFDMNTCNTTAGDSGGVPAFCSNYCDAIEINCNGLSCTINDTGPGNETCTPTCGNGQVCSSGSCVAGCTPECTLADQTSCTTDPVGTRICGNFDDDACLEWGTTTACSVEDIVFTCNNYACTTTTPSISNAYWAGYDSDAHTWLEINNASIGRVVQLVVTTTGYPDGTQVSYDIQRDEGNLHITAFNSTLSGSYSTAQWVIPSDLFVDNEDATYHFFFDAQVINSQKQSNNLAVSTNYEPPVNPPAGCGGAINESQCLVATPASCPNAKNQCTNDCSCYWDTTLGCKLQVSQECIGGNTLCRWDNETITTCTDGVRSIIREGGFNVSGSGVCENYNYQEPCGKASILLPFFSATNAIIIVLIIILIYVILMRKKLFKKNNKKKRR